jgi:hypothetical protein
LTIGIVSSRAHSTPTSTCTQGKLKSGQRERVDDGVIWYDAREENPMKTETIEIVDRGRGPQLSTSRITVLDIFYWLHRGDGWKEVHYGMPTLTREEFDVVVEYIDQHREELIERDRLAEERTQKAIAEQHARGGIFAPPDENVPFEERLAKLKEKLQKFIEKKNMSAQQASTIPEK